MGNQWSLQDAKNKFSAVVEAARKGVPQHVTKRGEEAVVVLAAEEYDRLSKLDVKRNRSFVEHLLNAPKLPEEFNDLFDKREPIILQLRDIDFDE